MIRFDLLIASWGSWYLLIWQNSRSGSVPWSQPIVWVRLHGRPAFGLACRSPHFMSPLLCKRKAMAIKAWHQDCQRNCQKKVRQYQTIFKSTAGSGTAQQRQTWGCKAPGFSWATFGWASCIIVQQGLSLSSYLTFPSPNPHFNWPSGYWPCVESYLVGGSDKYSSWFWIQSEKNNLPYYFSCSVAI